MDEKSVATQFNATVGMACDSIEGTAPNFANTKKRCVHCGSDTFESAMAEPQVMEQVSLPLITHEEWNKYDNKQKNEKIQQAVSKEKQQGRGSV